MRLPLLIFLFVWAVSLKAQVNLVPNPSFEEYTICPYASGGIWSALPWDSHYASVDYYHECGINTWTIPVNWGGSGYARTGQAHIGIQLWSGTFENAHEFAGVYLTDSLVLGQRYHVTFYLSLMDSVWYAIRNIGAYFSKEQPPHNIDSLFNLQPQVGYNDSAFLTDKEGWMKIQGSFIAEGGENFITIGNFDEDNETDTMFIPNGGAPRPTLPTYWWSAYYAIDDVSVTLDTTTGISETEKPNIRIFPNPASSSLEIQWAVGSKQYSVEVCDMLGQVAYQSDASPFVPIAIGNAQGDNRSMTINVEHFAKGIYLLAVKEKGEAVFWEKVVIE